MIHKIDSRDGIQRDHRCKIAKLYFKMDFITERNVGQAFLGTKIGPRDLA
jgi:hypothetical protein